MQVATTISWVLVVAVLFALLSQKKEFRYHKTFLQKEPVLTAVDVLAEREDSYTSSNGTKKRPNYGHTIIETNKNPRCHSN